jgi:hypothetical protein
LHFNTLLDWKNVSGEALEDEEYQFSEMMKACPCCSEALTVLQAQGGFELSVESIMT